MCSQESHSHANSRVRSRRLKNTELNVDDKMGVHVCRSVLLHTVVHEVELL